MEVTGHRGSPPALIGFVLAAAVLSGCGLTDTPAHAHAKSACTAYQELGRVQVATTVEQTAAIRDLARSNARAAAAFDPGWASLSADIQAALDLQESWQNSTSDALDRYIELDKRVQEDCHGAGRDIGDLEP